MHISPALVCWAWKWYPDPKVVRFDKMTAEQLKAYNTAGWWDIGVLSMSSYMVWVVLYYLKVCCNVTMQLTMHIPADYLHNKLLSMSRNIHGIIGNSKCAAMDS